MNIYEKLQKIQHELKAPKSQRNSFGGYDYRSCSDILESVKPLLDKYGCSLLLSDDVMSIGADNYLVSIATLLDVESGLTVETRSLAREPINQKGQSAPQMTGSASSYARKYALNGLFCIDDSKDIDSMDNTKQQETKKRRSRINKGVDEECPF